MRLETFVRSLAGLSFVLCAASCGGGDDDVAATLVSSIRVSPVEGAARALPGQVPALPAVGDGIDMDEVVTVTPASYEVLVERLIIGETVTVESDTGYYCSGDTIEIPVNETLDLASSTFQTVFESTLELTEDQLGQYKCLQLAVGGTADVTWAATVNGKAYDFSAPASAQTISLGWAGQIVALPEGEALDLTGAQPSGEDGGLTTTDSYTVGIVLDLNDSLLLRRISGGAGNDVVVEDLSPVGEPDSDLVILISNTPMMLPYVGVAQPVVDRYNLAFSATELAKLGLEATDSLSLRVNCVLGQSTEPLAADWTAHYGDTTSSIQLAFEPADPAREEITANTDPPGTYKIDDVGTDDAAVRDRALHFYEFQLANHTGTFAYGDDEQTVLEYTATKQ